MESIGYFRIFEKNEWILKNNWFFFKYCHEIEMLIQFNCLELGKKIFTNWTSYLPIDETIQADWVGPVQPHILH
jgi:hypothetical protein